MAEPTIITNNRPRDLTAWVDLPEDAQSDFEYLRFDEQEDLRFVKYKGEYYDVNETEEGILGWDACIRETFFSGVLLRWPRGEDEFDRIIVGRYYV